MHSRPRAAALPVIAALAALAALAVTASAASFRAVWRSPEISRLNFAGKKIAALVVADDMSLRMSAEEALASELTARGVNGVAAYRLIPNEELRDKDKARSWFERTRVDGVVLMRPLSAREEVSVSPMMFTSGYYGSLWDYYGYAWNSPYAIGPARTDVIVTVETLIYGVADGHLIWASTSEKTNPKGARQLVSQLVKDIVKEMRKEGLVPEGAR